MTAPDLQGLIDDLVHDEDLRLHAYDDATGKELKPGDTLKGNVTIGVGRNLTGKGVSSVEAMYLSEHDVAEVINDLQTFSWWPRLNGVRQRALANMRFNLGPQRFREFNGALAALAVGNYSMAASHIRSSKAGRELGSRYQRIADMVETGLLPAKK